MFSRMVDILVGDAPGGEIDLGLLATSELVHAGAIKSAVGRGEYLASRTWLRHALADYLCCEPSAVRLGGGQAIKDEVVYPATDLTFSFSYTGRLMVLAAAFRRDIGVAAKRICDDIELPVRVTDEFTVEEELRVGRSHDPVRTFWKLAVRKRALAKSVDERLAPKIQELDVSGPSPVEHLGREIVDLYVADDVVAAVSMPPGVGFQLAFPETVTRAAVAAPAGS